MFLSFLRTPPIFLSAGEQTEEEGLKNRKRRSLKTFGTMKCVTIRKQEKNCGISFSKQMRFCGFLAYYAILEKNKKKTQRGINFSRNLIFESLAF